MLRAGLLGHVGGNTPVWPISHISVWNCVLSGVYVIFSEALDFPKLSSPYSLKRFPREKLPNVSWLNANSSLSSGLIWTSKCFVSKITPSILHLDLHGQIYSASVSPMDGNKAWGNVSGVDLVTRKSAPRTNIRQLNNSSIYWEGPPEDTPQKSL